MSDITALCRQAGMDPAEYINNGSNMDTVRQAAVDYLLKHGAPVSSRMGSDEGDSFRQAAVDAMLLRAGVDVQNPARGAATPCAIWLLSAWPATAWAPPPPCCV